MKAIYAMIREDGAVKVGTSNSPAYRVKQVSSDIRQCVRIACRTDMRADAAAVENVAHKLLAEKQRCGKWFNVTADEAIAAITRAIAIADGHQEDVTDGVRFWRNGGTETVRGNAVRPGDRKTPLGLRMDDEIKAMAQTIAKMENRTLTNLIEVALEQYCRRALKQHPKDETK